MALDSSAAFVARAVEIGIDEAELAVLGNAGINSYSKFAFCCSYQPGAGDEGVLFQHLEDILGTRPTQGDASNYRRLFFESHALALKICRAGLRGVTQRSSRSCPLRRKCNALRTSRPSFLASC